MAQYDVIQTAKKSKLNIKVIAIVGIIVVAVIVGAIVIYASNSGGSGGNDGGGLLDNSPLGDKISGERLTGKYMCINDKVPLHFEYLYDGYIEFSGKNEFKAYNLYDFPLNCQGTYTIDGNIITLEFPVYREDGSDSGHFNSSTVTINDDRTEIALRGRFCIYKK